MSARRVAAIDCGTNSIRLLIADVDTATGALVDRDRRMEIVRLGEGVDRTGRLADAALERTFAACAVYASAIEAAEVEAVRFVATSASRDADNREDFVSGVLERIGVLPEVVSGTEEAMLSFDGATREVRASTPGPYLVLDIGGGSTEFVLGTTVPTASRSVDMGCVRLTERYLRSDPPTPDQIAAARAEVERLVDEAGEAVPFGDARTVIGLAGSVTTVAAVHLGLTAYDSTAIHLSRLSAASARSVSEALLAMSRAERAALPVMHPGRVDVIGGGALVLDVILARLALVAGLDELVVSEHDILDGIAWSLAGD